MRSPLSESARTTALDLGLLVLVFVYVAGMVVLVCAECAHNCRGSHDRYLKEEDNGVARIEMSVKGL